MITTRVDPALSAAPGSPVDEFAEHGRYRIHLHDRPHRLEGLPAGQLATAAKRFVRTHPGIGAHYLVMWCRADLLARQFARPNGLQTCRFVVALQATDLDEAVNSVVLLAIFDGAQSLGPVARALTVKLLCVTTSRTLLNSPGDAEFAVDEPLYIVVDADLVSQLTDTFEKRASIRWAHVSVGGDRFLHAFVFVVDARCGSR